MIGSDVMVLAAVPAAVIAWLVWRGGERSPRQLALVLALIGYLAVLIAVTLFPLPIDPRIAVDQASTDYLRNNIVPLASIRAIAVRESPVQLIRQVAGNVIMFIPLGLLLPLVWAAARKFRVLLGVVLSAALAVEASQLVISTMLGFTYRQADVDDVILNVAGGLLGYCMFLLVCNGLALVPQVTER